MVTRHSCRTVRPPTPESNTPTGRGSMLGDAIAGVGCGRAPPPGRLGDRVRGVARRAGPRGGLHQDRYEGRDERRRADRRELLRADRDTAGGRMAGRRAAARARADTELLRIRELVAELDGDTVPRACGLRGPDVRRARTRRVGWALRARRPPRARGPA